MNEIQIPIAFFMALSKGIDQVRDHALVCCPSGVDDEVNYTGSAKL